MSLKKDFNKANLRGTTLLFDAIEEGRIHVVSDLVAQGADVGQRTRRPSRMARMIFKTYIEESTPLHVAAMHGDGGIVDLLLRHDADPNAENIAGRTPLDEALQSYAWYRDELKRKTASRFYGRKTMARLQDRVDGYTKVAAMLLERGARPGLFALPAELAALAKQPEQKKDLPPQAPQPGT